MVPTTEGTFRVLPGRSDEEWLFLDVDSMDPTYVSRTETDEIAIGNRVEATLEWPDGEPSIVDLTVLETTRFRFLRTDAPVFQAAQHCFEEARRANDPMNAQVTRDTDGRPNGVIYTFAEQPGQRDLFAEFADGQKPLEPLLERAATSKAPPFSVWVVDVTEPFVLVTIVFDPDGVFEETMCETYLE